MAKTFVGSLSGTLFSSDQRQALDAIGAALKHRNIDFETAAELSDLVRNDRTGEALERLTLVTR